MSVLVEAYSVIVSCSLLSEKYAGGVQQYKADCPNKTFCTDDIITRVGFISDEATEAWVKHLSVNGLVYLRGDYCVDVAVIVQDQGFLGLCVWLEGGVHDGISRVWLKGKGPDPFVTPPGWTPAQSVEWSAYQPMKQMIEYCPWEVPTTLMNLSTSKLVVSSTL
ncbi:MAG: hypothetical protein WD802_00520 [Gemmatimonadaceae bacterium]